MTAIPKSESQNPKSHLILGTAGHIDHGKTALVKALTGVDTDRLKEEQKRGISIELGYARLELPSGTGLSVIDVPGHERFVRNMVAGASGVDIFLLVVAADDGVMPQTREHLAIIEMLGIPRGVVAITKADLVDEEMLQLVEADVGELLAGGPYEGTPMVAVSARTGAGLPRLLGELEEAASQGAIARSAGDTARLPVDRVFTLKGIGTVVTGTLWSGRVCAEDSLTVAPDGLPGRVRGVQVHDQAVTCAEAGQRVAVNLSGVNKEKLKRGQMLVKGDLTPTYMVDARVRLLPTAPGPLKYGAQVRLHHGTADATAKLMFADRERLEPGESCLAQVRLKTRVVAARGDRFILRLLTPVTTVGGGSVIDPHPRKHGRGEEQASRLAVLESGSPAEVTELLLAEAGRRGLTTAQLAERGQLDEGELAETLAGEEVAVSRTAPTGTQIYFSPAVVAELEEALLAALAQRQHDAPADPSLSAEELARAAGMKATDEAFQALVDGLMEQKEIGQKKQRFALASAEARLSDAQRQLMDKLTATLSEADMTPPLLADLKAAAGGSEADFQLALKLLAEGGSVVRVKPELYFSPAAVARAREAVIAHCQKQGQITLAELRDILGVSRKFAQALLEFFDRDGLTRRMEDYRVLRKKNIRA